MRKIAPLHLSPTYTKTIWGNHRISQFRGYQEDIGSWWEVSSHPHGPSYVSNVEGHPTLLKMIEDDPEAMLGPGYSLHEMLRCAFLDTKDHLSIQVHPDDVYAQKHANDYGKDESWYILDAAKDAYLVAGTTSTDPQVIHQALDAHALDPYLKKWYVQAGDFITIPHGCLHALGKDILAFEVGTNSDTTYRFYDYDRTDALGNKRPLHIKESFDVADFSCQPNFVPAKKESHRLADTDFFQVDELYLEQNQILLSSEHYLILTNLEKKPLIYRWEENEVQLEGWASLMIPYAAASIEVQADAHVLLAQPKKGEK